MRCFGHLFVLLSLGAACQTGQNHTEVDRSTELLAGADRPDSTFLLRFAPPNGFERAVVADGGFAGYLRHLPLKPRTAQVLLYNGQSKWRQDVHAAVIDMSVGDKDLQQCADAVMRLRAEFLFASGRSDEIAFDFTNGFRAEWKRWRKGERIKVEGNNCRWVLGTEIDGSYDQLLRFLQTVFTYSGTLSLERELRKHADVSPSELEAGDVFIQGGSPGHAVIVVDKAQDPSGRTAFMLAQSYMPAQDIHILRNNEHPELGAWFLYGDGDALNTPEWTFGWGDRLRWP